MKTRFKKHELFFIWVLIPLIKPVGLTYIAPINTIFRIWKLISLIVLFIYILKIKSKDHHSVISFGIGGFTVFEIIYVYNTIVNQVNYYDVLNNAITNLILIIFIIKVYFSIYKMSFLVAINKLATGCILLQIVSMVLERINIIILRTLDDTPTYFFGADNYSSFIIFSLLFCMFFSSFKISNSKHYTKKDVFLAVAVTLSFAWTGSVTATIGFFCFDILILGSNKFKTIVQNVTAKEMILISAIMMILVMVANIQVYMGSLLRVLGKEVNGLSLNSRTFIWAEAIKLIAQRPILGYGELSQASQNAYILYGTSHAHDLLLEVILRTGIVGACAYFGFLSYPFLILKKHYKNTLEFRMIASASIGYFLISFMDSYPLIQAQYVMFSLFYATVWERHNYRKLRIRC